MWPRTSETTERVVVRIAATGISESVLEDGVLVVETAVHQVAMDVVEGSDALPESILPAVPAVPCDRREGRRAHGDLMSVGTIAKRTDVPASEVIAGMIDVIAAMTLARASAMTGVTTVARGVGEAHRKDVCRTGARVAAMVGTMKTGETESVRCGVQSRKFPRISKPGNCIRACVPSC